MARQCFGEADTGPRVSGPCGAPSGPLALSVPSSSVGVNLSLIEKAYVFSAKVHQGQMRLSGEPYLNHPLEVAAILADMKMDIATVAAGLLHDTVEDTYATLDEIQQNFGPEIAALVDGLTKISKMTLATHEEQQAENFRKMILAMAKDIRIVLIKLADRLHNMRTLEYLPPEKPGQNRPGDPGHLCPPGQPPGD